MEWTDEKFVAFDFETSGEQAEYALQPWRVTQQKAWATSLAIVEKVGKELKVSGGLNPTPEQMSRFLQDAIDKDQYVVGWNTAFDISWLLAYGLEELVFKTKWLDGMLLWKHYYVEPEYDIERGKKKSYSLKTCVTEVLPQFAGYEEDIDFHSTDEAALEKLHEYNVRDTMFTLRLAKHWWQKLEPTQLQAARIEATALPMVAWANLNGMLVDTLAANELRCYLTDTATTTLDKLAAHGVTEAIVRSPTKLAKLLFDDWKLPVQKQNTSKKTQTTSRSTDKEVLHELALTDSRVAGLRLYRESLNNRTKFADAPLLSVAYNEDDCTHPQARVFGTYSGRLTYDSKQGKNKAARQTGFALHQEKRSPVFRSIIIPPPGYTLVEFDAAGQEFRWMAIASGDPVMLDLCRPGQDPHSYMGAQIAKADYESLKQQVQDGDKKAKESRQLGKVANLSLQYRTSARKLRSVARVQYALPMDLAQATNIHLTYQSAYVEVPKYWETQIQLTKRLGYVETMAGRRVQVKGDWNGPMGWSMGSTSINYRIQGTGADQKYLAMAMIKPKLIDLGAYFAWDLHDGIYLYVPDDKVQRAAAEIKAILDHLPYQQAWGFTPKIELPWDCKIGDSWGDLKDYHP